MSTSCETKEQNIATGDTPATEAEIVEPLSRTSSQSADDTPFTAPVPYPSCDDFHPTKTLFIKAHGMEVIHKLGPSTQLEIPVVDSSGKTVFKSVRSNRWAGESVLQDAAGTVAARTSDRLSSLPLRTVIVNMGGTGGEGIEIKRRGLMTRACAFTAHGWDWEWRYGRKEEGALLNGQTLLILERTRQGRVEKVRVAQLVRDHESRIEGSKTTTVGHGGRLDLSFGEDEEQEKIEALVVMTCLVMLKKEMDRRRTFHPIPISPVFAGSA